MRSRTAEIAFVDNHTFRHRRILVWVLVLISEIDRVHGLLRYLFSLLSTKGSTESVKNNDHKNIKYVVSCISLYFRWIRSA